MSAKKMLLGICLILNVNSIASFATAPSASEKMLITQAELESAQQAWAKAIVDIGEVYTSGGADVKEATKKKAGDVIHELYAYGFVDVLFKPTLATQEPFRPSFDGALSYFVGEDIAEKGFLEDGGFALGKDKQSYTKVILQDHQCTIKGETAQCMGEYWFTAKSDGSETKVEYTFGYQKTSDGKVRIYLHHSSLPFDAE